MHRVGKELALAARLVLAVRRLAEMAVADFGDIDTTAVTDFLPASASHHIASLDFVELRFAFRIGALSDARLGHGLLHACAQVLCPFLLHFLAAQRDVRFVSAQLARLCVASRAFEDVSSAVPKLARVGAVVARDHVVQLRELECVLRYRVLQLLVRLGGQGLQKHAVGKPAVAFFRGAYASHVGLAVSEDSLLGKVIQALAAK